MSTYDPNQPGPYGGGQSGGYPGPPAGQPGYGYPGYGPTPNPTESNWMGGWSLGLAIASLVCCGPVMALPAIIVGGMGIVAANEGRATNKGMSVAGLVIGVISIISTIFFFASGLYITVLQGLQ